MCNDALGDRMKGYENVSRNYLTRRVPVIVRIDGKAFHTFTKGLEKPFDRLLMETMQETMLELCKEVQGCVFGYTQSDEITLVLTDYKTPQTDGWFNYNIQKMASVSASMATLAFNRIFREKKNEALADVVLGPSGPDIEERDRRVWQLSRKIDKAMFDSRCFSIPKEEVINCLIWRQQDATRNSIEAVGQAYFSHSQLHGKNCDEIQDMLFMQKGINWNDLPTDCKRGAACYREKTLTDIENPVKKGELITVERNAWKIDTDIPVFTQDRNYVERHLMLGVDRT